MMQSSRNLKVTPSSIRAFLNHMPVRVVMALLMATVIVVGGWAFFPKQQAHAGSPIYTALLLIHGFQDTCGGAFNTFEAPLSSTNEATITFLQSKGWGSAWDPIDEIGYYSNDDGASCDDNVYDIDNAVPNAPKHCVNVNSGESNPNIAFGNTNDPLRHIACELAWYIYNTYTIKQIPVYVLAHSMGGLITRDAIAEAGKSANFPPAIDVRRVVTVATPHGGVYGDYNIGAQHLYGDSVELEDMLPGSSHSSFMKTISGLSYQSPGGPFGTNWYLMAASDACATGGEGKRESCLALTVPLNAPYPDGDGVVQSSSALQMLGAQEKVLYGVIDYENPIPPDCSPCYTADPNTQYEHEVNSGLNSPYYLNDATAGEQTTKAWVCYYPKCFGSSADFSDMNIGTMTSVSKPRSLQQISDWLPSPSAPTPTPTATPKPTPCVVQPNDTNCDNQDYIQQGCNSYPQSQVYTDSVISITLYYSTNCQSNWTWGKIQSNQASNYTIVKEDIERGATLQEPSTSLTEPVNNTSWYTNMLWAPNSPTRSCAWYKNNSSGAVSNQLCTHWSISCLGTPNDANCDNQSSVAQGCNDYPQTSPPPVDNGYVTVTVHYSTNCQSNWAVATLDQQGTLYVIDTITINRAAVSGGDGAASYSATTDNHNSMSPMVWAPNNPVQGCVQWTNTQSFHTYTTCTNTQ